MYRTAACGQTEQIVAVMKLHGSHVVMICCFLLQFSNTTQKRYIFSLTPYFGILIVVCSQGLLFLLYPLLGHLADVYLTRHRTLKCGLVILVTGGVGEVIYFVITAVLKPLTVIYEAMLALFLVVILVVGAGLFEANAIQFGLDQLLEAPTPKLITFIHWYYWSQNIGGLLVFYIQYSSYFTIKVIPFLHKQETILSMGVSMVIFLFTVSTLVLFCVYGKHFYIQRAGLNPFRNIYKVLRYALKHKVPEHRSAFTYWEEDIPPRIDLGKHKYGGPFTNEEVEDTKTFLRILPLLLCLFGYHVAGDGYSAPEQLQRIICPSLPVLLLIVANPLHMSALVTVVGIPLYQLVIMKIFPRVKKFLMLTKMWIGLYLSLLQEIVYIIVVLNDHSYEHDQGHCIQNKFELSFSRYCFGIRIGHNISNSVTCLAIEDLVDNTYLWFIIPQLLNGLSSLLVSMTVFEFICAQAPRTTQGLLIGLWYATFSIRYLVVGVLDSYITERRSWLICEGVKGFIILVSLVLFSCVSGQYHYRERDEIVNVQGMIEEIYERQLDQEEEYMQERRAFYQNQRAYNTRPQPYS